MNIRPVDGGSLVADVVGADPPVSVLGGANLAAEESTRAWLTGRGLLRTIEELAAADEGGDPIPTPGIDQLADGLDRSCARACELADSILYAEETRRPVRGKRATGVVAEALDAAGATGWHVRKLAELCLGVSVLCEGSDALVRAQRAAVVTLHPADEPAVPLVEDGVVHPGPFLDDFSVGLAGMLCRMIVDHEVELALSAPYGDGALELLFLVDAVGNLDAEITWSGDRPPDGLAALGWHDLGGRWVARWEDPMDVGQPLQLAMATLMGQLEVDEADRIALRCAPRSSGWRAPVPVG
jgi:hypothetical protein